MYKVKIKCRGDSFEVYLCGTKAQFKRLTVEDLWDKISEEDDTYSPDHFHLVFRDRCLDDDDSLYEAGIKNGSVIYLEPRRLRVGGATSCNDSMDRLADFDRCILQ